MVTIVSGVTDPTKLGETLRNLRAQQNKNKENDRREKELKKKGYAVYRDSKGNVYASNSPEAARIAAAQATAKNEYGEGIVLSRVSVPPASLRTEAGRQAVISEVTRGAAQRGIAGDIYAQQASGIVAAQAGAPRVTVQQRQAEQAKPASAVSIQKSPEQKEVFNRNTLEINRDKRPAPFPQFAPKFSPEAERIQKGVIFGLASAPLAPAAPLLGTLGVSTGIVMMAAPPEDIAAETYTAEQARQSKMGTVPRFFRQALPGSEYVVAKGSEVFGYKGFSDDIKKGRQAFEESIAGSPNQQRLRDQAIRSQTASIASLVTISGGVEAQFSNIIGRRLATRGVAIAEKQATSYVAKRTLTPFIVAGAYEAGTQEAAQQVLYGDQRGKIQRFLSIGTNAAAGAVSAPLFGIPIIAQAAKGRKEVSKTIETFVNILDPSEKPGDVLGRGIEKAGVNVFGIPVLKTTSSATTSKKDGVQINFNNMFQTTTRDTRSRNPLFINTPTRTTTPSGIMTSVFSPIMIPSSVLTPINTPNDTPTNNETNTSTQVTTPVDVPVNIPIVTGSNVPIPPIIPGFGDFGQGAPGGGKRRNRGIFVNELAIGGALYRSIFGTPQKVMEPKRAKSGKKKKLSKRARREQNVNKRIQRMADGMVRLLR